MPNPSNTAAVLASKHKLPVAVVEQVIREETATMSETARVRAFIPIFVERRVEERLRTGAFPRAEVVSAPA
jgi:hypothetical protein